jgi:hypothetical protein
VAQLDPPCGALAGLARTLFMEDRLAYGTSLDVPRVAAQLPTLAQLQALTQLGGEYAVALRGGRALSLRLQAAVEPLPRRMSASWEQTGFVSGGAKVTFCQTWRNLQSDGQCASTALHTVLLWPVTVRSKAVRCDPSDYCGTICDRGWGWSMLGDSQPRGAALSYWHPAAPRCPRRPWRSLPAEVWPFS